MRKTYKEKERMENDNERRKGGARAANDVTLRLL